MSNAISINNLRKKLSGQELYAGLSFEAKAGEITAIFGPNGCGKSTLLNILSGVAKNDGGEISIENLQRFSFSYIFQNYRESLLPWRTSFDNIAFPLEIQHKSEAFIRERIQSLGKLFATDFDLHRHPYELSGGQQQAVAFLRALANQPTLLFMDEPFSALDYENSLRMRRSLQEYYAEHKPTILFISHDIEEAVHLASRIVVLSQRPTSVAEVINNDMSYPRTLATLNSEQFHQIKNQVLTAFQKAAKL
ncbi:ABC transporter ATP-binding protein [Candidatus Peregrinibacteria bacterium]|nr:ABC transporter ATP-binding protein [Candidatus Peregrinibacteria bacterium]